MVDMRRVVLDYYYNPLTKGSNSLKYLLPACLNTSKYLQGKYSRQIGQINLTSKNFPESHVWLQAEGAMAKNPYKLLPPLFEEWTEDDLETLIGDVEDIEDGGDAMMAYAKLQYCDMQEEERKELIKGLLQYCELDTLAMVMLYEHFRFDF